MRTNVEVQERNKMSSAVRKTMMTVGLLSVASVAASGQNYSAFTGPNGLNAPGVVSPDGKTITFPLVRQELSSLTIKLAGMPAVPAAPESVANGYVNVQQDLSYPNTYFVDGAFPAQPAELPQLEAALELVGLPITAVLNEAAGTNKPIFTVHVEGTISEPATVLAGGIATALGEISNPQLSVDVRYPGVVYPDIPKKFQKIVGNGQYELVDFNAIVFSLPRADVTPITLGTVVASPSVGVAQTIVISGNGQSVLNAELALKPNEVAQVEAILIGGGFTISSQSDYFTNDSKRLTFIKAIATAPDLNTFQQQAEQLGDALLVTLKK